MTKLSLIASIMLLLIFFGGIGAASAAEISVGAPLSELKDPGQTLVFPILITGAQSVDTFGVDVTANPLLFTAKANDTATLPNPSKFFVITAVDANDKAKIIGGGVSIGSEVITGSATLFNVDYILKDGVLFDGSTTEIIPIVTEFYEPVTTKNYTLQLPDKVPPAITFTSPLTNVGHNFSISANITDVGGVSNPASVTLTVNGASIPASVDVTNPHDVILSASVTDVPNGVATLIITATDDAGNVNSSTLSVTVDSAPDVITVNPTGKTINATESLQFSAVVADQYGQTIIVPLTWTLEPAAAGNITSAGLFTAADGANGAVKVIASAGGKSGNTTVTVLPLVPTSIDLTPVNPKVSIGRTTQFTAAVKDQLGNPLVTPLTWASSDTTIGTIDGTGLFTANATLNGTTTVTVNCTNYPSISASTLVTVQLKTAQSITIAPTTQTVVSTQNTTFTTTVTDQDGFSMTDDIIWTVVPVTAGYVDVLTGKFTANATTSQVTATVMVQPKSNLSIHANATVTISPLYADSVTITKKPTSDFEPGDTFQFAANVTDQFGNPLDVPVTWTSSTAAGTINSTGFFTAVSLGTPVITASSNGKADTANVNIVSLIPRNITVSPAVYSLTATQNVTFTANVTDKNGQTIVGAPVSWTLTPSTAGVIDTNGKFTADAKASGMAVITVIPVGNTSIHANATVTINPLVPASVNITAKPSANLEVLDTFQFTSAVKDQLGNPFVTNVTWSSSNTTVGTIDSAGKFTATALGSTVITVKCDDNTSVTDTANVIVVAAVPRSITIDPTGTVVNSTESVSFNVTVKDKNGNVLPAEPINWTLSPVGAGNLTSSGTSGTFTAAKLIETDLYATITAQPAGNLTISANATVAVKGFRAAAINLTNSTSTVEPGKTFQFTADVKDQFGNDFPEGKANLTWTSSNTAAGTISGTGLFTAGTPGTTTITAASGSVNSSVEVKVYKETAPVFDVGVNKTGDNTTITSGLNTTITTSGNTSTITDSVTGTLLYLTFNQTPVSNATSVDGNITGILAEYPVLLIAAPETGANGSTFRMNLSLNDLKTILPDVIPAVNETKQGFINSSYSNYKLGAMVEVKSSINDNITQSELIFTIPQAWVTDVSKLKVLYISDTGTVTQVTPSSVVVVGTNYVITVIGSGFSAYAVIQDTTPPVPPTPSGGGGSGGSSVTNTESGQIANNEYITGATTGVTKITFPSGITGPVTIFIGYSAGAVLPKDQPYYQVYDVHVPDTNGQAVTITFGVPQTELDKAGKKASDIIVLHNIDGTWYELPVTLTGSGNGIVTFTVQTTHTSPFLVAYDVGKSYPSEKAVTPTATPSVTPTSTAKTPAPTQTKTPLPLAGILAGLGLGAVYLARSRR